MTNLKNNLLLRLKSAETSVDLNYFLSQFYNETFKMVYNYCLKKGLSKENTEDITQIVYTQIYKKRLNYNPDHSPLAWLYIITKSEAKDYLKKLRTYKDYLEDYNLFVDLSQSSNDSPSNIKEDLLTQSKTLSQKEADLIKERFYEEKDFQDIAADFGLSEANVRKIISRALKKLRKEIL